MRRGNSSNRPTTSADTASEPAPSSGQPRSQDVDAKNRNMTKSLLVSDKEAAAWIGISRATFWRRVADGTLPKPIRICGATRWWRTELLEALAHLSDRRAQD